MIKLLLDKKCIKIEDLIRKLESATVSEPFNSSVIDFISDFSFYLINNSSRDSPDLHALGYWFRKQKVLNFKDLYSRNNYPVGTIFHICPSNVDTIFVYSLLISLLMGNVNIIRISSKESNEINELVNAFNMLLSNSKYLHLKEKIFLITYDRSDDITESLSSCSNLRVFWGGAQSIQSLRKIAAPSYTSDIFFPDRESICYIDSIKFNLLKTADKYKLFENFLSDIKLFNQQACSSPLRLFWSGTEESFIDFLNISINSDYDLGLNFSEQMDKFVSLSSMTMDLNDIKILSNHPNKISFVSTNNSLTALNSHVGNGVVVVTFVNNILDILPYITSKTQTLSYFGLEPSCFEKFSKYLNASEIDRVCKIGSALAFDHVWDGKDLFLSFSRKIKVDL